MMPPPLAGPRLPSAALSMFSLGSGWGRGLHLTIWGGGGGLGMLGSCVGAMFHLMRRAYSCVEFDFFGWDQGGYSCYSPGTLVYDKIWEYWLSFLPHFVYGVPNLP